MKLAELLERTPYEVKQGSVETEISTLVYDSRKVEKNSVFVCISGSVRDAHEFIPDVVEKGAAAVIVEKEVEVPEHVTVISVEDTRYALACMAAAYFGHPAEKLKTIGITGTKGKTTTTYMIKSILEASGIKTGLIGTIEIIIGDKHIAAKNTTPDSYEVQEYFHEMVEAGIEAVVMEVSSQGLMLHRVSGFTFDYGVFTNLEPDHIGENEHKDFADYMHCKSLLFQQCRQGILNADSEHLEGILKRHTCKVETFGYSEKADLRASDMQLLHKPGVLGVKYHVSGLLNCDVDINVPGRFSVYNSLKEYNPKRLVCLFGCGGNRAKSRRYEMGEVSSKLADLTVVTSDNPRFEEPMDIIEDILIGVKKADGEYVTIPDRKDAIEYCIKNAKDGDVIILAGKGHEDYQEIKGEKFHMDERELIADILKEHPEYTK